MNNLFEDINTRVIVHDEAEREKKVKMFKTLRDIANCKLPISPDRALYLLREIRIKAQKALEKK